MKKDTKIIQIVVVDGTQQQVAAIQKELINIKKKLNFDAEFLITNDKIRFQDVKKMISELYTLYKLGEEKNVK